LFDQALREARGDPILPAVIERDLAWAGLMYGDVQEAAAHARRALELAEGIEDPAALAETLTAVALAEAVLGEGIRTDVLQRAIELEEQARERLLAQRSPVRRDRRSNACAIGRSGRETRARCH
jgi:hypothetical protein